VQYDPLSRYFESEERTLRFSGDNGVPLIRYNILDTGGVIGYDEMLEFLTGHGFDPLAELEPQARGVRPLPFVYVFGRSDFTVSFFGANIYPENVSIGLEQPGVSAWVTGKFVLEVKEDDDQNRFLAVTVELAPGIEGGAEIRQAIAASILSNLLRLNSEFANYVPAERRQPTVELRPTGDPEYFPVGVKHRYTRR
jgi:phenylacetate-CoA ligase